MKKLLFLLALSAFGQTSTITITGNVTATAGTVSCTGTPGTVAGTVKAQCVVAGVTVLDATITPQASGGGVVSYANGSDNVTVMLTKSGANINWQATAISGTGPQVTKSGSF